MADGGGRARSGADWAKLLKENWERLASSRYRDFFVASHPGWDDPERWDKTASEDLATLLAGFDAQRLAAANVLEIGCGVGRLGRLLAPRVRSYTGIDIAPSMLVEARERCAGRGDARFLETDGLSVPAAARDRSYDLALAASVFIHCPRAVIEALVRDAYALLARGGRLRFHVLADPYDEDGFATPEAYARSRDQVLAEMAAARSAADPSHADLLPPEHYMGDAFRFAEISQLCQSWTGGRVSAERLSIGHHAGWIEKPL